MSNITQKPRSVRLSGKWAKATWISIASKRFCGILPYAIVFIESEEELPSDATPIEVRSEAEISSILDGLGFNPYNADYRFQRVTSVSLSSSVSDGFGGCFIALGRSGAGKSTLLKSLGFPIIEAGEPTAVSLNIKYVILDILSHYIHDWLGDRRSNHIFVVDSFRELVYSAGGNALSGGISSGMLTAITMLSNIAARAGYVIIGSLNPMDVTGSDDREAALLGAINGACSGTISGINIIDFNSSRYTAVLNARHLGRRDVSVDETNLADKLMLTPNAFHNVMSPSQGTDDEVGDETAVVNFSQVSAEVSDNDRLLAMQILQGAKSGADFGRIVGNS